MSEPVPPKRVLFVDDEASVRMAIKMLLTHDGHVVEAVDSGLKALELFSVTDFDLVITDNYMPGMDGVEFSSRIKKVAPDFPVIMLTAFPPNSKPEGVDLILRPNRPKLEIRKPGMHGEHHDRPEQNEQHIAGYLERLHVPSPLNNRTIPGKPYFRSALSILYIELSRIAEGDGRAHGR